MKHYIRTPHFTIFLSTFLFIVAGNSCGKLNNPEVPDVIINGTEATVRVREAGTLPQLIDTKKYNVTALTLSGKLNGWDIGFIREMAGEFGMLTELDLSQTVIVAGGKYDYISTAGCIGNTYYTDEAGFIHTNLSSLSYTKLKEVILPAQLDSLGTRAFYGCNQLTSIEIPTSCKSIGNHALSFCAFTTLTLPPKMTDIRSGAFMGSKLTTITLPEGIQSVTHEVFSNCEDLRSILLPKKLTCIESNAFYCCYNLTTITLPEQVSSIQDYAFYGCPNLQSIYSLNPKPPIVFNAFNYMEGIFENTILHVPAQFLDQYRQDEAWGRFQHIKGIKDL